MSAIKEEMNHEHLARKRLGKMAQLQKHRTARMSVLTSCQIWIIERWITYYQIKFIERVRWGLKSAFTISILTITARAHFSYIAPPDEGLLHDIKDRTKLMRKIHHMTSLQIIYYCNKSGKTKIVPGQLWLWFTKSQTAAEIWGLGTR